MVFALSRQINK